MPKITELKPISPTKSYPTEKGGMYGAPRWYGAHKGQDFKATWGSEVIATEDGMVVFSGMIEGSKERTRYGNTVVIDHTPGADPNQRHIYTLSAHLNNTAVHKGQKVTKGQTIGTSGNSGTKGSYADGVVKPKQTGYHLHLEVIDSPHELKWTNGSFPRGYRIDPINEYIGKTITIINLLSKEEMNTIKRHLRLEPHIDFKRGTWHTDVSLGGKKLGRIDKYNLEIDITLRRVEIDRLLRTPAIIHDKP